MNSLFNSKSYKSLPRVTIFPSPYSSPSTVLIQQWFRPDRFMLTVSSPSLCPPALALSCTVLALFLSALNPFHQAFLPFLVWSCLAPLCPGPAWLYPVLGRHSPGTALKPTGPAAASPALTMVLSPGCPSSSGSAALLALT